MSELVRSAADYRRGYASGIVAAADALLADLEDAGELQATEYDDDGAPAVCKVCTLAGKGFRQLTNRLDFALSESSKPTP